MSSSDPQHILLEPYCILCRNQALFGQKTQTYPDVPQDPESWEEEALCFFGIPTTAPKSRRHHVFRFRTEVGNGPVFPVRDEATTALLDEARLKLCYGCPQCDLERTANLVHLSCLQLATLRLGNLSVGVLCDLAWLLRPVVAWKNAGYLLKRRSYLYSLPGSHVSSSTALGSLIQDLRAGLPPELQSMVCSVIPVGLFSSLSCCLETLAHVQEHDLLGTETRARKPLCLSLPLTQASSPRTMSADVITVLGERCLARLTGDDQGRADITIELSDMPIKGVQYALGAYGIIALRVYYQDGSASPWLGNQPRKWFKFAPGSDLSRLQVQSDGCKLLSLAFLENEGLRETSAADTMAHVLWSHDLGLLADHKVSLFNADLREIPVRGNPGSHYGQYFPLPLADGEEHGLTLFCGPSGISVMQIDGDEHQRLGKPAWHSCPVTFYLQADEVVDSVYSIHRGSPEASLCFGPFLLMQTSLGRCLYYGPYITPATQFTRGHLSAFGNEATHRAKGLFIDRLISHRVRQPSIGAVQEPREQPKSHPPPPLETPAPRDVDIKKLPGYYWQGTFVSKAVLLGARELTQQRVGDRVRGLLARFPDGRPVQIIGAWDPAERDTVSTIFAAGEEAGPLSSLTFVFSDGPARQRSLRRVLVNSAEVLPEESSFKWDRLGEELAWYFSHEHDFIEPWDGLDLEIKATGTSLARIAIE